VTNFHDSMLNLVRDGTDLTSRQLVILLQCRVKASTVRGMAEVMNVPKPAITRAVDRLQELGLVERRDDPDDRRSILVWLTDRGWKFTNVLTD
jgi:DNA-binding MarR family transcriptional regulator